MFLGSRTTIHPAPDLDAAEAWATAELGIIENPRFSVAPVDAGSGPGR